jgi:hypothetical protein
MTGFEITMIIVAVLATAGLGYIGWLLYQLAEGLKVRAAETHEALRDVKQTFLEADQSFKRLIDTLGAFEQMQQILELVKTSASHLSDAHDRIGSQLEVSGRVVSELHALVAMWAKEGSALQQSYIGLSSAVEQAIIVENQRAVLRNAELQALLREHATGARPS